MRILAKDQLLLSALVRKMQSLGRRIRPKILVQSQNLPFGYLGSLLLQAYIRKTDKPIHSSMDVLDVHEHLKMVYREMYELSAGNDPYYRYVCVGYGTLAEKVNKNSSQKFTIAAINYAIKILCRDHYIKRIGPSSGGSITTQYRLVTPAGMDAAFEKWGATHYRVLRGDHVQLIGAICR